MVSGVRCKPEVANKNEANKKRTWFGQFEVGGAGTSSTLPASAIALAFTGTPPLKSATLQVFFQQFSIAGHIHSSYRS